MQRRLDALISNVRQGGKILDVGCAGYKIYYSAARLKRVDLVHYGVDYSPSEAAMPDGFTLKLADLNTEDIPFEDDSFDLVIASHIIEHIKDPIRFFGQLARVVKPGGIIYLEAPSERSLTLPGMFMQHAKAYSLSFYDDPTHVSRPWTPQSLDRLARCFYCEPVKVGYNTGFIERIKGIAFLTYGLLRWHGGYVEGGIWLLIGWASFAVISKPESVIGAPKFRYYLPTR